MHGSTGNAPRAPRRFNPRRAAAALLCALLGALLVLGACQRSQRRTTAEESLSRAIAVVNNEKILFEDFQNQYQLFLTRWDRFIQNDPQKKLEIKELLLRRIIDERLIDQEARRKGIEINDAELNSRIIDVFGATEPGAEEASVEAILAGDALVEWSRAYRRRLTHAKVVQQEVLDKIRITPAEMRAYYDKHRDSFKRPERVKVRHIAVGSRSLYNRVTQLIDLDRDFVELVRQYSITPDRHADGLLGFVERGVLPKEFDEAIFKMDRIGSITPRNNPVQTQMGYHIFRLEAREPAGLVGFRRALEEIRERLLREKQTEAYERWLANLHQKATIVIDDDLLNAD